MSEININIKTPTFIDNKKIKDVVKLVKNNNGYSLIIPYYTKYNNQYYWSMNVNVNKEI